MRTSTSTAIARMLGGAALIGVFCVSAPAFAQAPVAATPVGAPRVAAQSPVNPAQSAPQAAGSQPTLRHAVFDRHGQMRVAGRADVAEKRD